MKQAALAFPNEHTVPVAEPEKWVLGLEYLIPHLDPMFAVLRQKGGPPRVVRLDPEILAGTEKALTRREPSETARILKELLATRFTKRPERIERLKEMLLSRLRNGGRPS
jgi:hypothetical protein